VTLSPLPPIPPILEYLDYLGIGVFAVSGALVAAQSRQTLVTFFFFAVVTGVGGGTVRDLLIGVPVFWVDQNWVLLICVAAALFVWFTPLRAWGGTGLIWLDAVGMASYATYGTTKGLACGAAHIPAFTMGILTACAGGIIRDLLAGQPSVLLRPELYVTAAAASAGLMVLITAAGAPVPVAAVLAATCGFALRGLAITKGWSLPPYHR
jgi:uncharacterized membrane protein YeiH